VRAATLPHLFVPDRPPAMLLAELGDLGGAIGATLLVATAPSPAGLRADRTGRRRPGRGAAPPD
jgi:hypothetical protein